MYREMFLCKNITIPERLMNSRQKTFLVNRVFSRYVKLCRVESLCPFVCCRPLQLEGGQEPKTSWNVFVSDVKSLLRTRGSAETSAAMRPGVGRVGSVSRDGKSAFSFLNESGQELSSLFHTPANFMMLVLVWESGVNHERWRYAQWCLVWWWQDGRQSSSNMDLLMPTTLNVFWTVGVQEPVLVFGLDLVQMVLWSGTEPDDVNTCSVKKLPPDTSKNPSWCLHLLPTVFWTGPELGQRCFTRTIETDSW